MPEIKNVKEIFNLLKFLKSEYSILIDCEKLDFINSSGLRILIMSLKKLKSGGKQLMLCNLQKNIKEVFQYSGFDKLFDIHLNKEDAIIKIS